MSLRQEVLVISHWSWREFIHNPVRALLALPFIASASRAFNTIMVGILCFLLPKKKEKKKVKLIYEKTKLQRHLLPQFLFCSE